MEQQRNGNNVHNPLNQISDILDNKYKIQPDQLEKRQPHIVPQMDPAVHPHRFGNGSETAELN